MSNPQDTEKRVVLSVKTARVASKEQYGLTKILNKRCSKEEKNEEATAFLQHLITGYEKEINELSIKIETLKDILKML